MKQYLVPYQNERKEGRKDQENLFTRPKRTKRDAFVFLEHKMGSRVCVGVIAFFVQTGTNQQKKTTGRTRGGHMFAVQETHPARS